tara:strand:- start:157 stop:552 length:396 start_codon:yes stop_codon:yes gene_type:complete
VSENLKQMPDDVDTIEDLVKFSLEKDYNKANEVFGNVMTIKMNDVLDQAKTKIAGQIYNGDPEDEEIEDEVDGDDGEAIEDDGNVEDETIEDEAEDNDADGDEEADVEDEEAIDDESDESDDDEEIEGAAV